MQGTKNIIKITIDAQGLAKKPNLVQNNGESAVSSFSGYFYFGFSRCNTLLKIFEGFLEQIHLENMADQGKNNPPTKVGGGGNGSAASENGSSVPNSAAGQMTGPPNVVQKQNEVSDSHIDSLSSKAARQSDKAPGRKGGKKKQVKTKAETKIMGTPSLAFLEKYKIPKNEGSEEEPDIAERRVTRSQSMDRGRREKD